jgi:BMFP domain-containing protein YqiC
MIMVVPSPLRRSLYRRGLPDHQAKRPARLSPRRGVVIFMLSTMRAVRAPARESAAMQTRHRLFDDAAKLAGGAIGTLAGVRREIEALARQQLDRLLDGMDLVTRDEFEAVKAMAAAARAENERLAARIAVLEGGKPARKTLPKTKAGRRKGASRPTAGRAKAKRPAR